MFLFIYFLLCSYSLTIVDDMTKFNGKSLKKLNLYFKSKNLTIENCHVFSYNRLKLQAIYIEVDKKKMKIYIKESKLRLTQRVLDDVKLKCLESSFIKHEKIGLIEVY
jgi:hypothetical protein